MKGNRAHKLGRVSGLPHGLQKLAVLVERQQHDEVVRAARDIQRLMPKHPFVLKALSFGLLGQGNCEAALDVLQQAVAIAPDDPELYCNMGIAQSVAMQWADALVSFERALVLNSDDPVIWKNKGFAFCHMNRWSEAIPCLLKAIELFPGDDDSTIEQLADALVHEGRTEEALACYMALLNDEPGNPFYLGSVVGAKLRLCEWSDLSQEVQRLRTISDGFRMHTMAPLHAMLVPGLTELDLRRIAEAAIVKDVTPELAIPVVDCDTSVKRTKLRIGYVSYDFNNHAVAHVIPQVFELHDRERVDVVAYSLGPDDDSSIRHRLANAVDQFVEISHMGVHAAAQRIAEDDIDVLVDLQGWTTGRQPGLFALRPARVNVNWLGFAGTVGHSCLADFIIGDPLVIPEGDEAGYTENVIRLPHCYLPIDTLQPIAQEWTREEAGLPRDKFVFSSPNSFSKLNPEVFDAWCAILRATPDSVLWLAYAAERIADNLRREAQARGVAPQRLIFSERIGERDRYLSRLRLADLVLDPSPYNSHASGLDVLWAGVPMVTLYGQTFPGRVGASLLTAAGLPECITYSWDEYIGLCVSLYHERDHLANLREKLLANRATAPLFDMPLFVRNLEDIYCSMMDSLQVHTSAVG